MVALETLGRRVSEDRPQTKFTRNPSYAEDVKWLLGVAKKLGLPCMQNFLMCVMATVVSPFVLQELTWDCGCYLSNVAISTSNASGSQQSNAVIHQIRTQPYLTSLVQKCYQVLEGFGTIAITCAFQMYYQCIHQRLYHLTPAEYEDFTGIILHARKVPHQAIFLPLISLSRPLCGLRAVRTSSRTFSPPCAGPRAARRTSGQRSQLPFRMQACPELHNRNHF